MDKVLSSADMTVLRNNCLAEEEYTDLALFFKMFADPTRLKILDALAKRELCVQDLCVLLEMQQSAVSINWQHCDKVDCYVMRNVESKCIMH